jgi:hypothetical protein
MKKKKQVALYLSEEMIKQAKLICIENGISRVNDFYLQAIAEKIERDGAK